MKTKIKILLFAIPFAGTLSSCSNDFLERSPLENINDDSYWKTTSDLKNYVNNLYNLNDLLPLKNGWASLGIYSDDADNGSDTYIYTQYNTRMNGEATIPETGGGWSSDDWTTLRDINYFLDHYKSVEDATSFDEVKPYIGEALFFRALFYYSKLRKFGALPIIETTVTTTSDVLFAPRSPRNEVADFIILDLDNAVGYLPAGNGVWTGRVNRETAMALQARVALFEGTWEKYHANDEFAAPVNESQKFLAKAADVADKLITMAETGGYPALDNVATGDVDGYWKLFNQNDYATSREVLFWRKYRVGDITNNWNRYSCNGAGRGLTKNMVESYLCIDGKPIAGNPLYRGDKTLKAVVANRDPRLNQTLVVDDGRHVRWYSTPEQYFTAPAFDGWDYNELNPTGYQLYKGHGADYTAFMSGGDHGIQGQIYFRYGETLLVYAEAKAELGSATQADLDRSVNLLRARVRMPPITLDEAVDPTFEFADLGGLIQAIRRERKVELACEGFRVDDIFRWAGADALIVGQRFVGAYKEQWNGYTFDPTGPEAARNESFPKAWSPLKTDANGYIDYYHDYPSLSNGFGFNIHRDYLQPLPTNELTLNPKLRQNPGW